MDNTLKKFITASIAEFRGSGQPYMVFKLGVSQLTETIVSEARALLHSSNVVGTANLNVVITVTTESRSFTGELIVLLAEDSTELISAMHASLARMVKRVMPDRDKLDYPALAKACIADVNVFLQLGLYLNFAESVSKLPEGPIKAAAVYETMAVCQPGIDILVKYRI